MKIKFSLKTYIVASILTHILITLAFSWVAYYEKINRRDSVEVVLVDTEIHENEKDKTPDKMTQIVETDSRFANNQLDDKAKYNSEKSNTVERETRAKSGEQFKNALKQGAPTTHAAKNQKQQEQKLAAAQLLTSGFDPYAALVKKTEAQTAKAEAKAKTGAQAGDTSTTNDHLNAEEDLITRLNTKEYKYYGYYHRIKLQLNQWWQPKVREKVSKMMSRGRTVASEENRITRLVIILNNAGTLVKVQVLAESGVRDLDDAAVEAFRSAAPFPNPPQGLIEQDGTVKIRWDFVVES